MRVSEGYQTEERKNKLSIVHGFRDPVTKKTKHRVLENLGYVDEYLDRYEDPIAHFREVVRKKNEARKEEEASKDPLGSVYLDETMAENERAMKHLGFLPLSSIYHELKLDRFLFNRQRSRFMDYSLNDVMQLLVYMRILSPGSKRHSYL
ncbi:MAG: hypothetical protein GX335_06640 [Firmicutes bacterium]|nr:hypothetical protein [Bacillota bacterium]